MLVSNVPPGEVKTGMVGPFVYDTIAARHRISRTIVEVFYNPKSTCGAGKVSDCVCIKLQVTVNGARTILKNEHLGIACSGRRTNMNQSDR